MGVFLCFLFFSFLQNLIKNLPEQKELSNLAELKNEYEELCESEQFGIVVSIKIVPKITRIVDFLHISELQTKCLQMRQNVKYAYSI